MIIIVIIVIIIIVIIVVSIISTIIIIIIIIGIIVIVVLTIITIIIQMICNGGRPPSLAVGDVCVILMFDMHPVRITRIHVTRFSPRVGLPRKIYVLGT